MPSFVGLRRRGSVRSSVARPLQQRRSVAIPAQPDVGRDLAVGLRRAAAPRRRAGSRRRAARAASPSRRRRASRSAILRHPRRSRDDARRSAKRPRAEVDVVDAEVGARRDGVGDDVDRVGRRAEAVDDAKGRSRPRRGGQAGRGRRHALDERLEARGRGRGRRHAQQLVGGRPRVAAGSTVTGASSTDAGTEASSTTDPASKPLRSSPATAASRDADGQRMRRRRRARTRSSDQGSAAGADLARALVAPADDAVDVAQVAQVAAGEPALGHARRERDDLGLAGAGARATQDERAGGADPGAAAGLRVAGGGTRDRRRACAGRRRARRRVAGRRRACRAGARRRRRACRPRRVARTQYQLPDVTAPIVARRPPSPGASPAVGGGAGARGQRLARARRRRAQRPRRGSSGRARRARAAGRWPSRAPRRASSPRRAPPATIAAAKSLRTRSAARPRASASRSVTTVRRSSFWSPRSSDWRRARQVSVSSVTSSACWSLKSRWETTAYAKRPCRTTRRTLEAQCEQAAASARACAACRSRGDRRGARRPREPPCPQARPGRAAGCSPARAHRRERRPAKRSPAAPPPTGRRRGVRRTRGRAVPEA